MKCTFCKLNLPPFQALNQSPDSKNTLLDLNVHVLTDLQCFQTHENKLLFLKRLDVAKQQEVKTLSQHQQKDVLWN